MLASDLVEVVSAVHLSSYVEGRFTERGGLMIVGPPGVLKTTFISVLDRHYEDAIMLSDVNARMLVQLRDAIAGGSVRTLVFPELAKLYQRVEHTAANAEGVLQALAGEGFQAASFEDSRVSRLRARGTIIGAMTPATRERHFARWEENGFNRRFLWSLIRLADPGVLERAVVEWKLIDFNIKHVPRPPVMGESIPNLTTRAERQDLKILCKYQPGTSHALHLQLLTRVLAVLRWWYEQVGDTRDPMATLHRFAESLGRDGGDVELDEPGRASPDEEKRIRRSAASTLARARWKKKKRSSKKGRKRKPRRPGRGK